MRTDGYALAIPTLAMPGPSPIRNSTYESRSATSPAPTVHFASNFREGQIAFVRLDVLLRYSTSISPEGNDAGLPRFVIETTDLSFSDADVHRSFDFAPVYRWTLPPALNWSSESTRTLYR